MALECQIAEIVERHSTIISRVVSLSIARISAACEEQLG